MPKERELDLKDDDELLRLLFSSIDYHDGDITKVAISLDDLKERGFSLDIARIASQSIVNERALAQVSRAKAPEDRAKGYISKFSNLEINAELDTDANKLFSTSYSPMHGNDAHASLTCFRGAGEKRSYYLLARARLREHLLKNIVELERYPFNH